MSDLQIALIAAGALLVALVWIYNNWQERKHLKAAEAIFKSGQPDALLPEAKSATTALRLPANDGEPPESGGRRLEPHLSNDVDDVAQHSDIQTSRPAQAAQLAAVIAPMPSLVAAPPLMPTRMPAASQSGESSSRRVSSATTMGAPLSVPALPAQWADSIADCILRFSTPEPIDAAPVWRAQLPWAADVSKPIHWLVFDAAASHGGSWQRLDERDNGAYSDWAIALQLADRRGPVSESDLALFLNGAQKFVRQMGGEPLALPERTETLAYAAKLDRFCADLDIQFAVHIVEASGGVFAGSKLRSVAEAAGLMLEPDGVFRARDADGVELFTLSNLGEQRLAAESIKTLSTHGLTLTLDVPRVTDGSVAFDRMLATAKQLSKTLGGVLVDAQRAPLGAPMISGIRAKAGELQKRMRDGGIAPGSVRALRLFS